MPLPPFLRRHWFALVFGVLLAGCFCVHLRYNQRYIGAVDWYGYYQEGLLFKSGRATLPTELPATTYPSVVPLGYSVTETGKVVPQYPPGFPLLIAAAAVFGLEFYLMPLVGLASALVLFQLIRDLTGDRITAALYAVLWAFFPIVVFGSTTMMSDLVAALFVFLSYLLYRRSQLFWSAFALTFALAVRPTNVLYLLVFGFVLLRDRKLIRYGLCMILPGMVYALYNNSLFGAPWRTGYFDIRSDLVAEFFWPHLGFYLLQILLQFSPLVLLLCVWGFRKPRGEKLFFVAWFVVFLLFYCFWRSGGDRWWWTRFLLPGFAPVFLLSALGFSRVRELIAEKLPAGPIRLAAQVALFGLIGLTPLYYVRFGLNQHDLWRTDKGYAYYQVVRETEQFAPAGSYVGSVEFAGSFRLYSTLGSFVSVHDNSLKLVEHLFAEGRPVYLIVEPWNKANAVVEELMRRYSTEKVRDINVWGGMPVYRVQAPAKP